MDPARQFNWKKFQTLIWSRTDTSGTNPLNQFSVMRESLNSVGISSKTCLWPITGTNVKTNIFGTNPVTSANVNKKKYCDHFF